MQKILMILTSHRLDCLRLTMDLMLRHGSLSRFDRVVWLMNGVDNRHCRYIDTICARHPEVAWDRVEGPRGRGECISRLENECIRRYPHGWYVKIDEDIFTWAGWADRMLEAIAAHADDPDFALVTPLIPNNAIGLHTLLTRFYPDLLATYRERFGQDPDPSVSGLTWIRPDIAEWGTRMFIDLRRSNVQQSRAVKPESRYIRFSDRFSIGCIGFTWHHWDRMGGIPRLDEPEWCAWIEAHGCYNVIDTIQIVNHYAFYVQQEWLDRTALLEDLRAINLPDTLGLVDRLHLTRAVRVAKQIPGIIRRRWSAARARGRQTTS